MQIIGLNCVFFPFALFFFIYLLSLCIICVLFSVVVHFDSNKNGGYKNSQYSFLHTIPTHIHSIFPCRMVNNSYGLLSHSPSECVGYDGFFFHSFFVACLLALLSSHFIFSSCAYVYNILGFLISLAVRSW